MLSRASNVYIYISQTYIAHSHKMRWSMSTRYLLTFVKGWKKLHYYAKVLWCTNCVCVSVENQSNRFAL